ILFVQAEDGIRYFHVTGVQTCALPISAPGAAGPDAAAAALLRRLAANDPKADTGLVEAAYRLAAEAHAAQQRENGDPYITHPLRSEERRVGKEGRSRGRAPHAREQAPA